MTEQPYDLRKAEKFEDYLAGIPKQAQRVITRSIDSVVPTIDLHPSKVGYVRQGIRDALEYACDLHQYGGVISTKKLAQGVEEFAENYYGKAPNHVRGELRLVASELEAIARTATKKSK